MVSLRIEELEELIQRRLCVLDRLERAMARQTVSGDVPTHWVPKVSPPRAESENPTCHSQSLKPRFTVKKIVVGMHWVLPSEGSRVWCVPRTGAG